MNIEVMIEIPKGSRNKYKYDPESGKIKFDRMLFSSVQYPGDYGFITNTLAEDGDPCDAIVLIREATFPGCIIDCKPLGLFKMLDEKGPDHKILCVPINDPIWNQFECLSDVPPHMLIEIEHFFKIYKELEHKKVGLEGWYDYEEAIKMIEQSQARFLTKKSNCY